MLILTDRQDIENAQKDFIRRLESTCDKKVHVKLGHQGGTIECTINWSSLLGLWFHNQTLESRYWNAFGLSEFTPRVNSLLPIIVEVNPPIEGLNKSVQGAFVRNEDNTTSLVYRGKIGGGRLGVGRKLFFDNYPDNTQPINSVDFAIIGQLDAPDFIQRVTKFVKEVDRIKNIPR